MTPESSIQTKDPTRAQFDDSASAEDLRALGKQPELRTLQCSSPVSYATWSLVNEHVCSVRPEVQVRVFGHYSSECDLSFLRLLPNLRHFAADCLMQATGIEHLAELQHLESLFLGVFELTDFSVLERVVPGLRVLSLSATRSQRPSLAPLSRFQSLRSLSIEGHAKDIEALRELTELETLTLRSITTPDLQYLADLPKLWFLDIKLGGIRNFVGIEGKASIKYLELWQVRKLSSVEVVATLPGLQNLFLEALPNVVALPSLTDAVALRRVVLRNLKGLHDFTPLETAPALEEFALYDAPKQTPEELLPVLRNPQVRRVTGYFGSESKNAEFARLWAAHGKAEFSAREAFQYR